MYSFAVRNFLVVLIEAGSFFSLYKLDFSISLFLNVMHWLVYQREIECKTNDFCAWLEPQNPKLTSKT